MAGWGAALKDSSSSSSPFTNYWILFTVLMPMKIATHSHKLSMCLMLGLLSVLVACESAPTPTPTQPPVSATATIQPTVPPSPTPSPRSTNTPTPTVTATPTPTPTPTVTPTPAPSLKKLTSERCCTQPFWSADSKQVLFIDKPNEQAATGIYAVDIAAPGAPKLFSERIANFTSDFKYATAIEGQFAVVEQLSDGQKWRIRTGGRPLLLSPDRTRIIWNETPLVAANENTVTTLMGANRDGSEARPIVSLTRGSASAWLDDQRLLVSARLNPNASQELTLFVFSLADGSRKELAKSERLRGVLPSPNGEWVAFNIAFDDKNKAQNGLWLVKTHGSGAPKKLDFFGPLQWRDNNRFVYVPLETNVASHTFYEYDARSGASRRLTDPQTTPFKIANGDWSVSPDGNQLVFLNAQDLNLWLWTFP